MDLAKPLELVEYLRRHTMRSNVAVWRIPLSGVGFEADLAVQLGVELVDITQHYRSCLAQGTEFARLSASKLFDALDQIASSEGFSDCVLVYNLDLLLAGLKEADREQIWQDLYNRLPNRKRALLITIPDTATHLFPGENLLKKLQDDYRIT
jgi:hypothetical protein